MKAKKSNLGGRRVGAGRKPVVGDGARKYLVSLSAEQQERAATLGKGSVQAGVRAALDRVPETTLKKISESLD